MKLRPYQQEASTRILEALPTKPCVLAFCTGGGKTVTTHSIIKDWIKLNPTKRVLVLTHNQTVLRDNFTSDKDDFFEYTKEDSLKQAAGAKVVVTIPATIRGKNLGKFGLLVFDEAHEFFEKAMVSEIRKSIGKHSLLLLTASHGQFSKDTYHKELYSVMEGLDGGYLADAKVEIVSTKWHFTDSDYNRSDDLNNKYKFSDTEVDHACRSVLRMLSKTEKVRSVGFKFFKTKVEAKVKTTKDTQVTTLPKTLIAAHGVAMADKLYEWFNKQFPGQISISYADNKSGINADQDAEELIDFKENKDKRLLIVVRRGILGFDCPEIEYVLDMTASRNVDRTTQLLGRVLRKAGDLKKHYFKIVPDYLENYTWYQMGAVVALWHPVNNEMWAGQTSQVPVLIKEKPRKPVKKSKGTKNTKRKTIPIEKAILDFSEYREVFQKSDASDHVWMRSERFTTLKQVRNSTNTSFARKRELIKLISSKSPRPSSHESKLGQSLKAYTNFKSDTYDEGFRTEILKLDLIHFPSSKGWTGWSKVKASNSALNHSNLMEWKSQDSGGYAYAHKLGLIREISSHMERLWDFSDKTLEDCKLDALSYTSRTKWKGVKGAYSTFYIRAQSQGWLDQCCAHMKTKPVYSKVKSIESAKKYKSATAWGQANSAEYAYTCKRGWIVDCREFFVKIDTHINRRKPLLCSNNKLYKSVQRAREDGFSYADKVVKGKYPKCKGHTFRYATEEEVILAKKEGRFVE